MEEDDAATRQAFLGRCSTRKMGSGERKTHESKLDGYVAQPDVASLTVEDVTMVGSILNKLMTGVATGELTGWRTKQAFLDQTTSASAIGVSIPYASDIRRGRRRPHPRHWRALAELGGLPGSASGSIRP